MNGQIDRTDGAGFVGPASAGPGEAGVGARLRLDMVRLLVAQLARVLERERAAYPFIDTKFDVAGGRDFPADDPLRGPEAVYCWIQGRGLESLAEHGRWLERERAIAPELRKDLLERIRSRLARLMPAMEAARARNGGGLPFLMTPEGVALDITEAGVRPREKTGGGGGRTLSDLFYARGLMAAATWLGEREARHAAEALFGEVLGDIRSGRFETGQLALDPRNPVAAVPGRHSHAGRMIALGGCTLFWRATGSAVYRDTGIEFIDHILARHAQAHDGALWAGDFWEFTGDDGRAWEDGGRLWSDPGHATEFAGLAFAHLAACEVAEGGRDLFLRRVLRRNYENGFTGRGLVKAFDLRARRAINSDMPWWSLPETMRAAALAARSATEAERAGLAEMWLCCWNAFAGGYVRRNRGLMAVQCLDAEGRVSWAIPATPDIDPGYHTGLSLLGCLEWPEEAYP